jgi:CRISPR/Cas system-associated protein endoribonuclease Cas2
VLFKSALPPAGFVRLVSITDRQFGKMECFQGKKLASVEPPPEQMMLS